MPHWWWTYLQPSLGRSSRVRKSCKGTKTLFTNTELLALMLCERLNVTLAKASVNLASDIRDASASSQICSYKVKLQMPCKHARVKFQQFTFSCK